MHIVCKIKKDPPVKIVVPLDYVKFKKENYLLHQTFEKGR